MKRRSITMKQYEKYLNELGSMLPISDFIIAGKQRSTSKGYGKLLRSFDPKKFKLGFNEWVKTQV